MSESADHSRAAPRFPFVAALLCAACIGAAAWTWMRYSYCWKLAPAEWSTGRRDCFAEVAGVHDDARVHLAIVRRECIPTVLSGHMVWVSQGNDSVNIWTSRQTAHLLVPISEEEEEEGGIKRIEHQSFAEVSKQLGGWRGRWTEEGELDATSSRFHGASIAGLVVGAMGVFVFGVALRHWLGRRRKRIVT